MSQRPGAAVQLVEDRRLARVVQPNNDELHVARISLKAFKHGFAILVIKLSV